MKGHLKLTIPELCQADWNSMTPNQEGKHCTLCDKTVIDFTKMSPEQIKLYFKENAGKKVCGNLYAHQLNHRKNKVQAISTNFYRSIHSRMKTGYLKSAALIVAGLALFIAGCKSRMQGGITGAWCDDPRHMHGYTPADSVKKAPVQDTLKKDSK